MENLATYQVRNSVLLQRKLTETKRLFMEGALLHTRKILRKMLHAENIKYMYNKGEKQREREREAITSSFQLPLKFLAYCIIFCLGNTRDTALVGSTK